MSAEPEIILYHCRGARSFRALWMLEELEVSYDLRLLPFPPRVRAPEFLAINPLGTVPALIVDGTLMTESAAIVELLAARYGDGRLGVATDDPAFPAYLNYLHMGEATLTFPQTIFLRYSQLEAEERREPRVAEDYARWFLSRLEQVMPHLGADYACGKRFTAADISMAYAVRLATMIGLQDRLPAAALAYLERLSSRGAYQRALTAERVRARSASEAA